ncbi:hypothetical protein NDU88_002047 [Pleurodeles waltl]|uniref:Uncharacterized protein n=1 Tax=Pleurodeles waltl TaxID=8319 RepID=A0AAV7UW33_PLEWA|nr:hypothetical protein NDU88_002047 [Pleurodeles waltl]
MNNVSQACSARAVQDQGFSGPRYATECAAGSGDERQGEQPFYVKDSAERAAPRHVRCLLSSRGALTAVVQASAAQRPHLPKVRGNGGPPPGARTTGRTHTGVFHRYSLLVLQLDWQWSRRQKSSRSFNAGVAIPLVEPPSWFQRHRLWAPCEERYLVSHPRWH